MTPTVGVVIPTYKRPDMLKATLQKVLECDPQPLEVLVHVDYGDADTGPAIARAFPSVKVVTAQSRQGPGGGRNRLMAESKSDIVVSLDDDSYPIDHDFFKTVVEAFSENPTMGILAMKITHNDEELEPRRVHRETVSDFVGCGCAYLRAAFTQTNGYVPLQPAYGMEEVDVALQIVDNGYEIILDHDIRIRHATDRAHQVSADIVSAHIKNTLLLAMVRYPRSLIGLAILQYFNRVLYSVRRGHIWGVIKGVVETPFHIWTHKNLRAPVRKSTVSHIRRLRVKRQ